MSAYIHSTEQWGQPPASLYSLRVEGDVMIGSISAADTSSYQSVNQLPSSAIYVFVEALDVNPWKAFSDEELNALYAEFAEEDQYLAELGMADYARALQEEDETE